MQCFARMHPLELLVCLNIENSSKEMLSRKCNFQTNLIAYGY